MRNISHEHLINTENVIKILASAENTGRYGLYEHEVYSLLAELKVIKAPAHIFLDKERAYTDEELTSLPGEKVVLKIVSPHISHKTDVGGVKAVAKRADVIRAAVKQMLTDVADSYTRSLENGEIHWPDTCMGLSGEDLRLAIEKDIRGVIMVQYVDYAADNFGNELIIGIRNTRDYGMIITAGLGGTDTELFAGAFRKGMAFVSASTVMTSAHEFLALFRRTLSYKKLAGLTRGQKRVDIDEALIELFSSFISLANSFSAPSTDNPYVLEELEINPFVFSQNRPVPLDGLCRFSRPEKMQNKRPLNRVDSLLHPRSIGIIGVSTTRVNFGQIILNNVIAMGFEKKNLRIIKPGTDCFNGVPCVDSINTLDIVVDLLVVAVGADQVPDIVNNLLEKERCRSVILIPGGIGETDESEGLANEMAEKINRARLAGYNTPVFLGANSLGVVSHPGKYDTLFIPEEKLPRKRAPRSRNTALISQSGAFMITRLSRLKWFDPAYMISVGNQNDLTLGDITSYIAQRDDIDVIAIYAEGFRDHDGLSFLRAVKQASSGGKAVIVYKAGRTKEGKNATATHTAAIAGDYQLFESCVREAGGIIASSFTEFNDLILLAEKLHKKRIRGNRIAALSGAGFEAVGMADNIETGEFRLEMARFNNATVKRFEALLEAKAISSLTKVNNPFDINPAGDDETHILMVKQLIEDENVDAIIVGLDPLSPTTTTLSGKERYGFMRPGSMVNELGEIVNNTDKPVIGVIDAGELYDPMAEELGNRGMAIFRSVDRALRALALYINGRFIRDNIT
jgi:acyl-CoA synthetase (NDP forming)